MTAKEDIIYLSKYFVCCMCSSIYSVITLLHTVFTRTSKCFVHGHKYWKKNLVLLKWCRYCSKVLVYAASCLASLVPYDYCILLLFCSFRVTQSGRCSCKECDRNHETTLLILRLITKRLTHLICRLVTSKATVGCG